MSPADKRLAELTRVAQVALEAHRSDADDVSWHDFEQARDERDTAWLERLAVKSDVDAFARFLQFGASTDLSLRADEQHLALARACLSVQAD